MAPSGAIFICDPQEKSKYTRSSLVRNENDEGLSELLLGNTLLERPLKYYTQVINVTLHHFYITGEIESEVDRYIDMINVIKTAEPHDKIFIYLNTPGGALDTTIQIVSAMRQSQAEVTTVIEGQVCSGGTFIFLAGDNYIVNDDCSFMIHNYSHGILGKGAEVAKQVKFAEEYFRSLAQSFYKDFLTVEEIEQVCEDKDFWMGSDELMERLQKRGGEVVRVGADFDIDEEIYDEIDVSPRMFRRRSKIKELDTE